MTITSKAIRLSTEGHCHVVDITSEVAAGISESGIDNGSVTIFITGSTAGVTTIEFEPGLLSDLKDMWDRVIPQNIPYEHDRAWGDGNGHSHVRASLLGSSLVVPFVNKQMVLGTWQQIVVVDFDNRARSREIILQLMGE